MALAQYHQAEKLMNEQIYQYLKLLLHLYPTSSTFTKMFKKDMFINYNKVGFQYAMYYILAIYNPVEVKQKLSSWPIIDNQRDIQFRKQVTAYINELSQTNPEAGIPLVVESQLVNPGKYKFAKLMLAVIQFVVYDILSDEDDPNFFEKPFITDNDNYNSMHLKHLESVIISAEEDIKNSIQEFSMIQTNNQSEADKLSDALQHVNEEISQLEKELNKEQSDRVADNEIENLESNLQLIQNVANKFTHANEVMYHLKVSNCYLESDEQMNILEHFINMYDLIIGKVNDVIMVPDNEVDDKLHGIVPISKEYDTILHEVSPIKMKAQAFLSYLEKNIMIKVQEVNEKTLVAESK